MSNSKVIALSIAEAECEIDENRALFTMSELNHSPAFQKARSAGCERPAQAAEWANPN